MTKSSPSPTSRPLKIRQKLLRWLSLRGNLSLLLILYCGDLFCLIGLWLFGNLCSLIRTNLNGYHCLNLTIQINNNIVTTRGLNGRAADNTLAVNFNAKLLFNCLSNLCCCDRTKELAFLANLGINNDELTIKGSFGGLCVCKSLSLTLSNVVTALLKLFDITRGSRLGNLLREQEVLCIALSDLYDVALSAFTTKLAQKNYFHGNSLGQSV